MARYAILQRSPSITNASYYAPIKIVRLIVTDLDALDHPSKR